MKLRNRILAGLMAGALGAGASAETLLVGEQLSVAPSSVARPARGATQASVEAQFGAPSARNAAVGKPPISRWDYPGFAVFFENNRVIHAVAIGTTAAPAPGAPSPPAN